MAPPDSPSASGPLVGAALIALVPATADVARAAGAAWTFARHAAATGRRVALVDCYVDSPWLHAVTGEPNGDGIVDVFEYGASLSRIARPQPEPSLFFVPAGTLSADPVAMMANPRWARLAAGFRHEDATMLLFLPPATLGAVAAELDGLVALAPDGIVPSPEILAAIDGGVRLVATVTEEAGVEWTEGFPAVRGSPAAGAPHPAPARVVPRPAPAAIESSLPQAPVTPSPPPAPVASSVAPVPVAPSPPPALNELPPEPAAEEPAPPAAETAEGAAQEPGLLDIPPSSWGTPPPGRPLRRWRPPPPPSPRGRWLVLGFVALGMAGVAIAMYQRLAPHGPAQGPRAPAPSAQPQPAPTARPVAPPPSAPAPRTGAPGAPAPAPRAAVPVAPAAGAPLRADSLPFALQVSAFTRLAQAVTAADRLGAGRVPSMIAPIRIGERLWYRVYAGPVTSRRAADSLLAAIQTAGLDPSGQATVARVPLSFTVGSFPSESAARAAGRRLAAGGIATFLLRRADGSVGLLAGAYATAGQAADLGRLLTSTGNAGPLGPRVGIHP